MRKFFIAIFFAFALPLVMMGQDIIVKRDGSTIISKVLEVTTDSIKYKKQSNFNGPTYTMNLSDVLSINYANGQKDTFNKPVQAASQIKESHMTQEDLYINDGIISEYNDRTVISKLKKSNKQAKWVCRLLRVHPSSVVGNNDGRLHINIEQTKVFSSTTASFSLSVENTSDEMMYVDLGSSFFRQLKTANTYYVNSSTTTTEGIMVGNGISSSTSTTVYADRIITIPPHFVYKMKAKDFYNSEIVFPYKSDFRIGDRFTYPYPEDPKETPWEFIVSYAMENDLNKMRKLDLCLYISEEISVKA